MRKLNQKLVQQYSSAMARESVAQAQHADYLKWLRFYLDFCDKYTHQPRDRESLPLFMRKLQEKDQAIAQQKQAAAAVEIYYGEYADGAASSHARDDDSPPPSPWDGVYDALNQEIKARGYSPRTCATYAQWIRGFQAHTQNKAPESCDSADVKRYLSYLAVERHVAASTQNQAFNALLFLFRHILKKDYDLKDGVVRAKQRKYIPVVLSREEVQRVIDGLSYPQRLIVQLLYGCGLRLFECMKLRVQDFDFDHGMLTVHDGKGKKDRVVPLPRVLIPELEAHLERVKALHDEDLAEGYSGTFMDNALDRKYPNAAREFGWQWFWPAKTLTLVPEEGQRRRWHFHESHVQKAIKRAVRKAKVAKRVTAHVFRHSFASHLLLANYDIRTIQQLLGHSDVRTTMIYTHTVPSRTIKEAMSPLDM